MTPAAVASALGADYGRSLWDESIWLPRHLWGKPQVLRAVQRALGMEWHWSNYGVVYLENVIVRKGGGA